MNIINKSGTDEGIRRYSNRRRISQDVIPFVEQLTKRLVLGMISIDNIHATAGCKPTLTVGHLKRSLRGLAESGELLDVLKIETDDMEGSSGSEVNKDLSIPVKLEDGFGSNEIHITLKIEK